MATSAARLKENSRARRAQEKAEVRAAILSAASDEFLEHGYKGFSLRRVAGRVGYTPTTICLYSRDKDALLLEAVREGPQKRNLKTRAFVPAPRTCAVEFPKRSTFTQDLRPQVHFSDPTVVAQRNSCGRALTNASSRFMLYWPWKRDMAQLGSALDWGSRGRRFKSGYPDKC